MHKLIIASIIATVAAAAQAITFTNQTITVSTDSLSIKSVDYVAATTNAPASWSIAVQMDLQRGQVYHLNGHACNIDRFRVNIPIAATEAEVAAVFGDAYSAIAFAASNGLFVPSGDIADGFLVIGAAKLATTAD
jgi:hypothetical protein